VDENDEGNVELESLRDFLDHIGPGVSSIREADVPIISRGRSYEVYKCQAL